MLSISARGSATTAAAYYQHLATGRGRGEVLENYYAREQSGQWLGAGAAALKLQGSVQESQFLDLAQGFDRNGEALVQNAGDARHRAGWDLTFSAPKSASVAWALSDKPTRDAIARAHDEAVAEAVTYIERHAAFLRTGHAGRHELAAGLVVAAYRHGTSRAQDPQLHTHAFTMNVAMRSDGTTGTLQSRHFYIWQRAAGAAYRVALAERMKVLGYALERDGGAFRIASVPRELDAEFSQRRQAIEAELERRGTSGARAAEAATLATRERKQNRDAEVLHREWQQRARDYEFDWRPANKFDISHDNTIENAPLLDRDAARRSATLHDSTFSAAQAHAALLVEMQGKARLDRSEQEVQNFLEHDPGVVKLKAVAEHAKSGGRYTTVEMLRLEHAMTARAARMADEKRHLVSEHALNAAFVARPTLTDEQRNAVQYLTRESGGVASVQGVAGAGKSFSLSAARIAWETDGYTVHGIALSSKAGAELERGSGIQSTTFSAFMGERFMENERGEIAKVEKDGQEARANPARRPPIEHVTQKDIVVLDEAGMIGSRQMSELLEKLEHTDAKLILVGDSAQLQAIEAGAPFRAVRERLGAVSLNENRRQTLEDDRRAVAQLRAGDAESALKNLSERHRLHINESARETKEAMGRALAADLAKGKNALGVTATRQDSHDVNRAARNDARELGILEDGDTMILTRSGARDFAAGDRIVFTRNVNGGGRANEMGGTVKNGERGVVREIEPLYDREGNPYGARLRIDLDRDEKQRIVDTRTYDWIDHGYAVTAHKSQGATVDCAHVLATEAPMPTGREWSYVASSRHREALHIYADAASIEDLAPEWSQAHQKDTTLDYVVAAADERALDEVELAR